MAATKRKSADEGTGKPSGETGGKVRRTQNGKAAAEVKGKWYDKKKQLRFHPSHILRMCKLSSDRI